MSLDPEGLYQNHTAPTNTQIIILLRFFGKPKKGGAEEMSETPTYICGRCGKNCEGFPAISRKDNKTAICPNCGKAEAFEAYAAHLEKTAEDPNN